MRPKLRVAKKEKILIVDDEKIVGIAVKEELEEVGYSVAVATSGAAAVQQARRWKPAIAFVDLWMPRVNGVETCKRLKEFFPETEVVLISGRPDGFGGLEGDFIKAGGLNLFLYKPFQKGELVRVVKKIMREKGK